MPAVEVEGAGDRGRGPGFPQGASLGILRGNYGKTPERAGELACDKCMYMYIKLITTF